MTNEQNRFNINQQNTHISGSDCSVYQCKNETGEGTITVCEVFPGVFFSYNDFHMQYFQSEYIPKQNSFCIDHCREGRMEYVAQDDAYSYVKAGDLKLDRRLNHTGRFDFPLSHYHGLTITFDMDIIGESLPREIKDFPVDMKDLQEKYCPGKHPLVLHGISSFEHICGELYSVPQQIRKPYFKIKTLELVLYLWELGLPENLDEQPYFYKAQVEKVKAIKRWLSEHIDKEYTQETLAKQFDISLTTMKRCFKSVYGSPIGKWLVEYRMNYAAELLIKNRELSVTDISGDVGYESASKFAIAFRRVMGMSPQEYRKK